MIVLVPIEVSADEICLEVEAAQKYFDAYRNPQSRQQLATAHNHCGLMLANRKDWSAAESHLQKALRLEPEAALFKKNLAMLMMNRAGEAAGEKKWNSAERDLVRARQLDPGNGTVDGYLAQVLISRGVERFESNEFKEAKGDFEKALRYERANETAKMWLSQVMYRLESSTGRVRELFSDAVDGAGIMGAETKIGQYEREIEMEKRTREEKYGNWFLRYEDSLPGVDPDKIAKVIDDVAYAVGTDFQYWIKHAVVFVLVANENFTEIHGGPEWAGALNDGRIKIPVTGRYQAPEKFKEVLAHEYTHSVLNDFAHAHPIPFWTHEGLAQYEQHKAIGQDPRQPAHYPELIEAAKGDYLIPMVILSDPAASVQLDPGHVALAYQQSLAFVLCLEENHKFYSILSFLKEMGKGKSFDEAVSLGFSLDFKTLEEEFRIWVREQTWLK